MSFTDHDKKVLAFWEERAAFNDEAGTNDFMLTKIEHDFIIKTIPEKSRVLEIGCGNANALIRLACEKKCTAVGIDYAPSLVKLAKQNVESASLAGQIQIHQHKIPPVPKGDELFDAVLTNRCLNSLSSTEEQKRAVQEIAGLLKSGGMYLMIENTIDGVKKNNAMRQKVGLLPIDPPWHSLYFNAAEVATWQTADFAIEQFLHITSTYYFLSRVVNAKYAALTKGPLEYNAFINRISLMLPQQLGKFGPVKAWIWRKK